MPADALVQYGRLAHLGRVAAAQPLDRGNAVVVLTPRGVELGRVTLTDASAFAAELAGLVVRVATAADHAVAAEQHQLAHATSGRCRGDRR